jgi:hypothetical protein
MRRCGGMLREKPPVEKDENVVRTLVNDFENTIQYLLLSKIVGRYVLPTTLVIPRAVPCPHDGVAPIRSCQPRPSELDLSKMTFWNVNRLSAHTPQGLVPDDRRVPRAQCPIQTSKAGVPCGSGRSHTSWCFFLRGCVKQGHKVKYFCFL